MGAGRPGVLTAGFVLAESLILASKSQEAFAQNEQDDTSTPSAKALHHWCLPFMSSTLCPHACLNIVLPVPTRSILEFFSFPRPPGGFPAMVLAVCQTPGRSSELLQCLPGTNPADTEGSGGSLRQSCTQKAHWAVLSQSLCSKASRSSSRRIAIQPGAPGAGLFRPPCRRFFLGLRSGAPCSARPQETAQETGSGAPCWGAIREWKSSSTVKNGSLCWSQTWAIEGVVSHIGARASRV